MVVALGPGKFYGSGLPRPRFYTDVKFGPDRVDPPAPVMDPLLSWASEAHWSMGGLSFKRLRLQGRIEGNIERLRAQHRRSDRINKKKINNKKPAVRPGNAADKIRDLDEEPEWQESPGSEPEPEPVKVVAPAKEGKAKLRKRARKLVDQFEQVADPIGSAPAKEGKAKLSKRARKLVDQFEQVADPIGSAPAKEGKAKLRKRARKLVDQFEQVADPIGSAPAKAGKAKLRKRARKLVDEFEQVADPIGYRTRGKKPGSDKVAEVKVTPPRRTSPRKSAA